MVKPRSNATTEDKINKNLHRPRWEAAKKATEKVCGHELPKR
jgi:hypothetical protein